eukprot:TRINITY_DN15482_c0_g2_i1.p1 TRINITY_DN15482_c0_g2~~TRINITY_DN15482_c0_g2_i1.p1  ORF type:complete len:699 (-),score=200.38 TRINITY_DN15482_c0_g2_i1:46-2142(-)
MDAALVEIQMVVCNDKVNSLDLKMNMRLPLPPDSAVTRFSLEIDGDMVDATAVSKKAAAEIAYKEQEKGRDVAVAKTVSNTSVFETEIYPMPYQQERRVIVAFIAPLHQGGILHLPVLFGDMEVPVDFDGLAGTSSQSDSGLTCQLPLATETSNPTLLTATSFNRQHFYLSIPNPAALFPQPTVGAPVAQCKPPREFPEIMGDNYASPKPRKEAEVSSRTLSGTGVAGVAGHVAIVVDTSGGVSSQAVREATKALSALYGHCKVSLLSFNMELEQHTHGQSMDDALAALPELSSDGGTKFESILPVLHNPGFHRVVVLSDGGDLFGGKQFGRLLDQTPCVSPVDTVLLSSPTANTTLLKALAAMSGGSYYQSCGALLTAVSQDTGNTEERARRVARGDSPISFDILGVRRVEVVGTEDPQAAFMDDALRTAPDCRLLGLSGYEVSQSGNVVVTGTVGLDPPTHLRVTLAFGSLGTRSVEVDFNSSVGGLTKSQQQLVGLVHARRMLVETSKISIDPDYVQGEVESIGQGYNMVTSHTTLLHLRTADQFAENDIPCPVDHPAYSAYLDVMKQREAKKEQLAEAEQDTRAAKVRRVVQYATAVKSRLDHKAADRAGEVAERVRYLAGQCEAAMEVMKQNRHGHHPAAKNAEPELYNIYRKAAALQVVAFGCKEYLRRVAEEEEEKKRICLLYTSPSPRDS